MNSLVVVEGFFSLTDWQVGQTGGKGTENWLAG
jgi:hypothetical protein